RGSDPNAPPLRRSAPRPKHRARITATSQSAGRTGQAAHKDGRRLVTSRSGHDIRRRGRFLVGFLVGSALFTRRTAFGRRQFFLARVFYLTSSAGRGHPRPWLSSHTLGRAVALASASRRIGAPITRQF